MLVYDTRPLLLSTTTTRIVEKQNIYIILLLKLLCHFILLLCDLNLMIYLFDDCLHTSFFFFSNSPIVIPLTKTLASPCLHRPATASRLRTSGVRYNAKIMGIVR